MTLLVGTRPCLATRATEWPGVPRSTLYILYRVLRTSVGREGIPTWMAHGLACPLWVSTALVPASQLLCAYRKR